jgi:hypothetical protein
MIIDMTNQTAVEFLIDEIRNQIKVHGKLSAISLSKLKMQAKEMEKQQISEAYRTGVEEDVYNNPLRTGEMYYNQTFK